MINANDQTTWSHLLSNSLRSNENNLIYFAKQPGNNRENESFLLVVSCSRVTCCLELKLQYFFRKYILICTIYTLLMQLISRILCDTYQFMVAATLGKNLRPPVPQWRNGQWLFAYRKPRAVDNITPMFWGWYFKSSVCVCWAVIGNDATKIYTM